MIEPSESSVLSQYLAYPFESDANFAKGLSDIVSLASNNRPSDIPEHTLRSIRVFYFNRTTGNSLSVSEVEAYERSGRDTTSNTPDTSLGSNSAEPLSFGQIQALIEAGRINEIPNNKVISTELNPSAPPGSSIPPRKKPWEKECNSVEV
ncbi:hypothetical protein J3R30DRAFT_14443 [Lentinula aciculospora]|uniref:Uncharacterized protein n=1 Tax=Lentinula aciculospora TaxID=153920 RepID=A0A9W9AVK8_9AGAR|nr:hypothetical protein J3R30DRAFT_14443 [Lentinula aciculospora]